MISCKDISSTPPEIMQIAKEDTLELLPQKSREVYECAYNRFIQWCTEMNVKTYTESVLLAYFVTTIKSSTLWSMYSMLRSTLNLKNGINISSYSKLKAYLKKQNVGYKPKKSRVLTKEQMDQFLNSARDLQYLIIIKIYVKNEKMNMKDKFQLDFDYLQIILIIGVTGLSM